jgi:Zn-dependent peptidase ImmA (M78 family)
MRELGHAILHPKSNTPFLRANTLYSVNKLETEANRFMALLLHPATEIQDYAQCGYTLYQIADICGLTPELVEYIITTYNRNDAASS